jgi:hypothetical protein
LFEKQKGKNSEGRMQMRGKFSTNGKASAFTAVIGNIWAGHRLNTPQLLAGAHYTGCSPSTGHKKWPHLAH